LDIVAIEITNDVLFFGSQRRIGGLQFMDLRKCFEHISLCFARFCPVNNSSNERYLNTLGRLSKVFISWYLRVPVAGKCPSVPLAAGLGA
jgi:hypothetical protein